MAAGKATTRYRCSHRQCEEHGCGSEGSRAGIAHQVFRPHFKFRVVHLLGRIWRIVNFFHRSPTATAVLAAKQKLVLGPDINEHKVIVDVTICWNSSLDMLERYLDCNWRWLLLCLAQKSVVMPVKSTHCTTWTSVMPRTS